MSRRSSSSKMPSVGDQSPGHLRNVSKSATYNTLMDKATLAKNYRLLLKATECSDERDLDTPGYVHRELAELTFEARTGDIFAYALSKKLSSATDTNSKLKTLKTIRHLTKSGSKRFRKCLRDQDEHLKGAAEAGTEMAASSSATLVTSSEHGANPAAQVRSLAAEIRVLLFDQDTIDQDNDMEDELQPVQFAPGMGSSSRSDGKYEGFGTAPQKESVTEKMVDMVEQFLTFPDERKEVLEMCLATPSTGDYKPIDLPSLETSALDPMMMSSYSNSVNPMLTSVSVRKHVPGKAGGGWESDDEDNCCPDGVASDGISVDEVGLEACEGHTPLSSRKPSEEVEVHRFPPIETFLLPSTSKTLNTVEQCFLQLQEFDTSKVLLEIASLVATGCEENVIKLLLLLEYYLRLEQTDFAEVSKLFSAPLKELSTSSQLARQTVIKTNKVMFVIEANMRLQKNEKNVGVSQ